MENLLTVTNLNKSQRKNRAKTIDVIDYDRTFGQDQETINQVTELRNQIEQKEKDVVSLREALERDTEVDMTKYPEELKKLQAAFDQVQKTCAERIAPYLEELNQITSEYEGRQHYMESMNDIAQERMTFVQRINRKMDEIQAKLDNPDVDSVDEKKLIPKSLEVVQLESEYAALHRKTELDNYTEKHLKKLNDDIERDIKDADFEEKKEERRLNNVKEDISVRTSKPKPKPKVDQEWINSQKKSAMIQFYITEVNNAIQYFSNEERKISSQNDQQRAKLRQLTEDFLTLQRFLPGENGVFTDKDETERSDITGRLIEADKLVLKVKIAKGKLNIETEKLKWIEKKLKKFPDDIKAEQGRLEKEKNRRKEVETDLQNAQSALAETLSQNDFLQGQKDLMNDRLTEQKAKLEQIYKETKEKEEELEKQKMIMALNEAMYNLKKMNLPRVSNSVQHLIDIKDKISQSKQ